MKKCLDCDNPPPLHWTRCEDCAMRHLRHIMSGGRVPLTRTNERRIYAHGTSVIITPVASPESPLEGKVVRRKQDQYVIDLKDGSRYYAHVSELRTSSP